MIDISKVRWELTKEEKYAIQWLNDNGFAGILDKQLLSKTVFVVSKNGVTDTLEIFKGCPNQKIKDYMMQFEKSFALRCKIEKTKDAQLTKVYQKVMDGKVIQTAILRELPNGRFGFITSVPGKAYEVNVNMPMFETPEEAKHWIETSGRWQ